MEYYAPERKKANWGEDWMWEVRVGGAGESSQDKMETTVLQQQKLTKLRNSLG